MSAVVSKLSVMQIPSFDGHLEVSELAGGRYHLRGVPAVAGAAVPHSPCVTDYSLELIKAILKHYGACFVCDQIGREQDETEAALDVRHSVEAYFSDDVFQDRVRILDYGCGAGGSTVTLAELFPHAIIVGVDYQESLVDIARMRAKQLRLDGRVKFEVVPPDGKVGVKPFDFVFLNAVYEHLLPAERAPVIQNALEVLLYGGHLVINQTPHRLFPIETHTSSLPFINYLPDSVAHWAMRTFSRSVTKSCTWEELLRHGIRGATVSEIMRNVKAAEPYAKLLRPIRLARTWAGIWYATKQHRLHKASAKQRFLVKWAKRFVQAFRLPFSPYISIAVRK